ncbi:MAG: complex I NDUFA9 subunit family protein [Trueperaceae bacterium]
MRVLVTGANGFVGGYVCRALVGAGCQVTGLSRKSDARLPTDVTALTGDVTSGDGLGRAMTGIDAVVHLVGIIQERGSQTFERVHVEGTRNVIEAATAAGVSRLVHMSALGAGLDSGSGYQRTKARAEELVRVSGLAWTIMRPSLIFGVGDDFFGGTLRQLVRLPPVVPVVGTGGYPFRPVYAGDVATAFLRALERHGVAGQVFDLAGPNEYTLRELLLLVRGALGSRKPLVNVPLPLMRMGVALFGLLPNPPITRDQFLMLLAGNTGDPRPAVAAFGLALEPLEDHLGEVLEAASAR